MDWCTKIQVNLFVILVGGIVCRGGDSYSNHYLLKSWFCVWIQDFGYDSNQYWASVGRSCKRHQWSVHHGPGGGHSDIQTHYYIWFHMVTLHPGCGQWSIFQESYEGITVGEDWWKAWWREKQERRLLQGLTNCGSFYWFCCLWACSGFLLPHSEFWSYGVNVDNVYGSKPTR